MFPLIELLRARELRVLVTSGTVTSATLARERLPGDVIHQFLPLDAPRFVFRFLDHWQPDLGLFIESDLWPNLIVASSKASIPLILVNGRMSEQSFLGWRSFSKTASTLLGKFDLCLAQSALDAERFRQLGMPGIQVTGNLKLDVPAPPVDESKPECDAGRDRRTPGDRRRVDPSRRGDRRDRSASPAARTLSAAAHHHRAAPSQSRTRHSRSRACRQYAADAALVGRAAGSEAPTSISPTRSASSGWFTGSRQSCSWAARWSSMADRIRSRRSSSAPPSCMARMCGISPRSTPRSTQRAAPRKSTDPGELANVAGAWLQDNAARKGYAEAGLKTVGRLGGALKRTLAEIEPYLMQLAARARLQCVSRNSGGKSRASRPGCCGRSRPVYGAIAARRMRRQAHRRRHSGHLHRQLHPWRRRQDAGRD